MIKNIIFQAQRGLVIFIALLIGSHSFAATKQAESLDRIVAIVNDSVITQSELDQTLQTIKKQMQNNNAPPIPHDVLRKQVLDQLINKKIQMQLAEQAGINVSDADVDRAISSIAANNKISVKTLYGKVAEQGLSASQYRKEIREQMTLQQVQQHAVGTKITISPQEVDNFMRSKAWQASNAKEYHLEDILIALPEAPSPQEVAAAKKRADNLLTKLRQGTSFREAAAAESGEQNALQGGDLGWRKLPEIPSAFADKLVHAKANDLLGPIQTPNGFHIIHLVGVRSEGGHASLEQQRQQVQQLIFQRKLEEGLQSWITRIRSEAFINTHPEG